MKKGTKILLIGLLIQVAGLIYGIVNENEGIIVMCVILMAVPCIQFFNKKKN